MKYSCDFLSRILSPGILELANLFKSNHYQLRIAGGAVRDIVMGITPKDFDLATDATPTQMVSMFESNSIRMINSNGFSHGTVTARVDEQNYEVTTLRVDTATDGRRATVEYTEDWEEDSSRRDLTVNSMFMDFDGQVIDYFHGIRDVREGRVRFVNEPSKRIREDYLRILRYFRFFARISKSLIHEADTLEAIKNNAEGLENISGERVLSELEKLFGGADPRSLPSVITCMKDCQLFPYLGLPEQGLDEFYGLYDRCLKKGVQNVKFGTFISSLLPTLKDVAVFHARTKMSNECKHICEFIVEYRHVFADIQYQTIYDLLVERRHSVNKYHDMLRQLGLYTGLSDKTDEIIGWYVPQFRFPVEQLQKRGLKGRQTKIVVAALKNAWRRNDYQTLNGEQIDDIINNLLE